MSKTGQQRRRTETPQDLVEERHTIRAAEPRLDWRRGFLASDGLLIVLGIWLVASPSVLAFDTVDEKWPPLVCGALITLLAALALAGVVPKLTAAWTAAGLGAALLILGIVLADSSDASWNAAAGGAMVALLGLVSAAASADERRERASARQDPRDL